MNMLVTSQYQPRLSNIKCNQFSPGDGDETNLGHQESPGMYKNK
jgi:hypothetical protein